MGASNLRQRLRLFREMGQRIIRQISAADELGEAILGGFCLLVFSFDYWFIILSILFVRLFVFIR